ncbi:hypothetical protein [Riemerella anatipestifer]|uniref:hypothetical protein n=1 Tax=Riemerella anatipestifer TaxID=34085 RepID=UPI001AD6BA3E|nr:hypothetical protein [Riemerella anatipestifer]MBO4234792.1 hypothetical protein [Riemerella anatipestifer]MCW0518777.1 hypothetical protein [Riemerella anatipestifer]
MKKSIFAILFLLSIMSFSQTQTKRYNSMTKRYEYFDSRGNMIGYEFYNTMTRQWEYYENKSQNSEPQSLDISNLGNATTILQGRYDSNTAYVQQEINKMIQSVYNLNISNEQKDKIIQTFKDIPLKSVNSQTINYSNLSNANDVLNYLHNSLSKIIENVTSSKVMDTTNSGILSRFFNQKMKVYAITKSKNGESPIGTPISSDSYIILTGRSLIFKRADGTIGERQLSNQFYHSEKKIFEFSSPEGPVLIEEDLSDVAFIDRESGLMYIYYIQK